MFVTVSDEKYTSYCIMPDRLLIVGCRFRTPAATPGHENDVASLEEERTWLYHRRKTDASSDDTNSEALSTHVRTLASELQLQVLVGRPRDKFEVRPLVAISGESPRVLHSNGLCFGQKTDRCCAARPEPTPVSVRPM